MGKFLLTRLSRGATCILFLGPCGIFYFYSRASREARLADAILDGRKKFISTHAPLARRDALKIEKIHDRLNFYSRASREARHNVYSGLSGAKNFYSRASREARRFLDISPFSICNFYSRASREARPWK